MLAEGFEEVEALTTVDLLRRADIDVTMVSVTGSLKVTGSHNIAIMADRLIEETDLQESDIIILPGGMPGTLNLQNHEAVSKAILDFAQEQKWIAAICAAPKILGSLGILEGKHATCYPGYESELTGATLQEDSVVQDKRIITSRGLGTAIPFSLKLIEVLAGKDTAKKIAAAIIF